MKILVTGAAGQLGYDVVQEGIRRGIDMAGVSRKELNITDEQAVYTLVNSIQPDAIIHCAAYTAVDKAEDEKETCWDVNVNGTTYLAMAAKKVNAKFMYISTDYVFDGNGTRPFSETDEPDPICYYGVTKYEGERAVRSILQTWYIIRISWVFGPHGKNFVQTMLRLGENHHALNVVSDQIGSPTYTLDAARLLIDIIETEKFGIYHASNEEFCSWADFAEEIFRLTDQSVTVNRISTEQYPTRAERPKNSRMCKQKLVHNGFHPLPTWQNALERYLKEFL